MGYQKKGHPVKLKTKITGCPNFLIMDFASDQLRQYNMILIFFLNCA